jgi:hypothetical protein
MVSNEFMPKLDKLTLFSMSQIYSCLRTIPEGLYQRYKPIIIEKI